MPQKPLQHAGVSGTAAGAPSLPPLRASIPTTTTTTIPTQGATAPAAAAGFSNVCNVLMACLSTAPARPVVHQLLLEQQVTLCRLATGAARRSAAAACIEWCLQTTRPAAPEGRDSSSTGRMPKERPPAAGQVFVYRPYKFYRPHAEGAAPGCSTQVLPAAGHRRPFIAL